MQAHGPILNPSERQPYYIASADFDPQIAFTLQLHRLCSQLNQSGCEAYLFGAKKLNGHWWTPMLTLEQRAAHYKAGKKPLWIHLAVDPVLRQQSHWTLSYAPESHPDAQQPLRQGRIDLASGDEKPRLSLPLALPWTDASVFHETPGLPRTQAVVLADRYLKAGGKLPPEHQALSNLGDAQLAQAADRAALLRSARCLYSYEISAITTEALLCGCPVIYIQNDRCLTVPPASDWHRLGTAWGDEPGAVAQAQAEVPAFQQRYRDNFRDSAAQLQNFIAQTQQAMNAMPFEAAWSTESVALLGELVIEAKDLPRHADQAKYTRLQHQFAKWRKRSTLREIDGEIYAEHVAKGTLPPLAVCVYVRPDDLDGLAQTLDSLEQNFYQAQQLHILAPFASPIPVEELGPQCRWHELPGASQPLAGPLPPWLVMVESGTTLEPQALIEFALAARRPDVALIYADEAIQNPAGLPTPHFKPDLNTEWLRSTNYLGSAVAVRSQHWLRLTPEQQLDFDQVYGLALELNLSEGPAAFQHIDTVLLQSSGHIDSAREAAELGLLQAALQRHQLPAVVQAQKIAGCRQIEYQSTAPRRVSLIVPSGHQLGYLRCLLGSLQSYVETQLCEVIVVSQPEQADAVQRAAGSVPLPVPLRFATTPPGPYNHALALNTGAALAEGDVLLFADDDTEVIQRHWLHPLSAYLDQADVGCVAPRLVLQVGDKPQLQTGPMVLGAGDWARSYTGERSLLDEQGVFSRLQTSQDAATVAGHFFLVSRALWHSLGGFDTQACHTFTTVHDFCLRASQAGRRHIWTPIASVLHHGGKTIEALGREPGRTFEIKSAALREKQAFLARWVKTIARDGRYNRHLSLQTPYDVEADLVIDWSNARKDRPTVIAFPISSGSGQYRVVEPLNALQHAGLAQSCIVFPVTNTAYRTPNPLEVTRANPDRMIVQHSIGDAHLHLLRDYRQTNPDLFTIQMVDDLFHDLPEKHHLHVVHQREGYVRMREAMSLCDRVIVSTQPLVEVYGDHCRDVRVVPNCLDDRVWGQFFRVPPPRPRLRVGWAGAAQHLGDLEMIRDVVAAFKDEVDWIFMGMCPDGLRSYIKEFHPFVSYVDYPAKLASLDLDIAIAPLEDNPFNRCKSNLRLLEYGAMGWPVVCSDVYPFRTENPPVLRVANEKSVWIDAIRHLIDEPALRLQMGQQLHQWVSDHFYLSKNTDRWQAAIFD
ncbi:glycosyltransferase [Curvibacter sp. HBC61]|uniref:Glycosyltransferase n=1 Tax=Curvibacter cyanobacteriorum TaxID=3026422 RepID=A0ABT5N1T3_9BURK|nr:glycosyltransferase [Curvibacter sp. HBC61]MDD0840110.1 glycosyltransferase [Curvibacter sp. HBC61]